MRTALRAAKRGVDSPEYDVWVSDPAEVRKTRASFVAIDLWQRRWDDPDEYGRFTHEMIPEVTDGIQMSYGQLNWPSCYLILGHGDFRQYQYQIRARSDPCVHEAQALRLRPTLSRCVPGMWRNGTSCRRRSRGM